MTCTACLLHLGCRTPCLWGSGNAHAKIMLIGEAPGFNEDMEGKPFVGQAGQLLDYILTKLGLDRSTLYVTNVIKCRPSRNELPKGKKLGEILCACQKHLRAEVSRVLPKVVVLLGGTSTLALSGNRFISKVEGSVVSLLMPGAEKIKAVAAFHPAYVLRSPGKEPDLARALALGAKLAGVKINPKGYDKTGIYEYEIRT